MDGERASRGLEGEARSENETAWCLPPSSRRPRLVRQALPCTTPRESARALRPPVWRSTPSNSCNTHGVAGRPRSCTREQQNTQQRPRNLCPLDKKSTHVLVVCPAGRRGDSNPPHQPAGGCDGGAAQGCCGGGTEGEHIWVSVVRKEMKVEECHLAKVFFFPLSSPRPHTHALSTPFFCMLPRPLTRVPLTTDDREDVCRSEEMPACPHVFCFVFSHARPSLLSHIARGHQARPGRRRNDHSSSPNRPGERGDDTRCRTAPGKIGKRSSEKKKKTCARLDLDLSILQARPDCGCSRPSRKEMRARPFLETTAP